MAGRSGSKVDRGSRIEDCLQADVLKTRFEREVKEVFRVRRDGRTVVMYHGNTLPALSVAGAGVVAAATEVQKAERGLQIDLYTMTSKLATGFEQRK